MKRLLVMVPSEGKNAAEVQNVINLHFNAIKASFNLYGFTESIESVQWFNPNRTFSADIRNSTLARFSEVVSVLSRTDLVVFTPGCESDSGCMEILELAKKYGVDYRSFEPFPFRQ